MRPRLLLWLSLLAGIAGLLFLSSGNKGRFAKTPPARKPAAQDPAVATQRNPPNQGPHPDDLVQTRDPGQQTDAADLFPVVLLPTKKPSASEAAFFKSLKPRVVPPKEPLVIPAGNSLRLSFKLADVHRARANADGRLHIETQAGQRLNGFVTAAREFQLRFKRVHTATDEALLALEMRAAQRSGTAQPDLGGLVEAAVTESSRERVVAAALALHALPEVEFAELESLDQPPPPPAADIAPTTPSLVSYQTYRGAATGIDVDHVWNTYGVRGHSSLQVTDCEYKFNVNHEDLAGLVSLQPNVVSMYGSFGDDHGTAVLGILAAGNNDYGMTGSIPDCSVRFYPEYSTLTSGSQLRPACVTAAIAASLPGDIVVLEMQTGGVTSSIYVPAEYDLSVFNSVKTGTDAGVLTVAAAGNGGDNLDGSGYASYRGRGDSGAIIVGAGNTARARQSFSTYGARVNLQGWGGGVATTGYGTLATYGGDPNQEYASGFNGTSSATPIVTSAAALLQSLAIEICETRLTPLEIRSLLVSTGRAQTGDTSKPIGPLPDLQAASAALFAAHPPVFSTLRSWSLFHFGNPTPSLTGDHDGDGIPSLLEYVLGTDPETAAATDITRLPRLLHQPANPGTVVFEFNHPPTRSGAPWKIQRSSNLVPGSWQDVVIGLNGITSTQVGDLIRISIPTSTAGTDFFRLHVSSP